MPSRSRIVLLTGASAMNSRRFVSSMGTSSPDALSALSTSPVGGFPQPQPAAEESASPWGRSELF
jgi:hypothetical protein